MSSSQPFQASSPLSPNAKRRRKSRFTYKNLHALASYSTTCPLRVIAHIDLDAFYAQCEMVRLGVPEDKPLAVQQWQGLIAINYPARAFGLNRHVTISEAQKACPDIIMQHVATWKEGEDSWAYRDDAFKNMGTHKVSLDPYRLQSRTILALIKDVLPSTMQKVEKASIDEVFLDLSAHVHSILVERYPVLKGPAPYDDTTENLPAPPTTALDWTADALIDLDKDHSEEEDPDWDDIAINIGAEIVRGIRAAIREQLKYTCSAGLARNKMLAKLGSGHKKPNNQTIVRNRAVQQFLGGFKFANIRNLGGKLGDEVAETFQTDTVKDLLEIPIEQFKRKFGDGTGSWLHAIIRGDDHSEVSVRTQIKSMLSAKSFRPSINTHDVAVKWLRIFTNDIYARLVEDGLLENRRRPRTINLHHRQGAQTRSKQAPIPQGKSIDKEALFEMARNLLAQVIVDGRAWPCSNLSLSVGGFEDGPTGNKGIGTFLVRGEQAKALHESARHENSTTPVPEDQRPSKRRKMEDHRIRAFFPARDDSRDDESDIADFDDLPSAQRHTDFDAGESEVERDSGNAEQLLRGSSPPTSSSDKEPGGENLRQPIIGSFFCDKCRKTLSLDQQEEHQDWHFAKELQDEQSRQVAQTTSAASKPATVHKGPASRPGTGHKAGRGRGRPPTGISTGSEKGQKKLAFG